MERAEGLERRIDSSPVEVLPAWPWTYLHLWVFIVIE